MALATAPGRGALAIVRMSGPEAVRIAHALLAEPATFEPRRATFVRIAAEAEGGGRSRERESGGVVIRDEAVMTWYSAPASATGQDVVEVSVHGSTVVSAAVISSAVRAGARLAEPGEFTLRAFLNGKLDLTRAEAIRDLVAATTARQAEAAFDQLRGSLAERIQGIENALFDRIARLEASVDFPEEGFHFIERDEVARGVQDILGRIADVLADARRGRLLREGSTVAIVGRPNVGKSRLFNRLVGAERAIVATSAGTTRDVLVDAVALGGTRVTLADTAGIRGTSDSVENEGVARARAAAASADLVLAVVDGSEALTSEDGAVLGMVGDRPHIVVVNKSDLAAAWTPDAIEWLLRRDGDAASRESAEAAGRAAVRAAVSGAERAVGPAEWERCRALFVSALTGAGLDELVRAINRTLGSGDDRENLPAVTNARHVALLDAAAESLSRLVGSDGVLGHMPEDVLLTDLREASDALGEVTGRRTTDELLERIFSTFCIGK